MVSIISIIVIVNIGLHLLPLLGVFKQTENKLRIILVTDIIICAAYLACCPISAVIWIILSIIDWKHYGYVFKNFL